MQTLNAKAIYRKGATNMRMENKCKNWLQKIITCCCVIYFFLFCVHFNVCAKEAGDYKFEGYGMQYDPYLITSYEDICALRDSVDNGNSFSGVYFKQTDDIIFPPDEQWNPIGDAKENLGFSGYYNGNGHTISDIYCEDQCAGLFSLLDGEVRNLGIESGIFKGDTIGSITSHGTTNASIVNCYNKADVIGNIRAGGIADNFPGSIVFCWNLGKVSGLSDSAFTAGICSYGEPHIMYCYDYGTDKLVNDATFTGSIVGSFTVQKNNIEDMLLQTYRQMYDVYSDVGGGILLDNNKKILINRGSVVFMRWMDEKFLYDLYYEPDIFKEEKNQNEQAFLSVYNTRFDFKGKGTEKDPFQISSYEDLVKLRDCVDIGITYRNYCFIQTNDIVFPDEVNWDPIGDVSLSMPFSGTYDGNGHSLFNIFCDNDYAGVFSFLDGEVRNLGIENGTFKGSTIGSITSHGTENACITNCYNKAKICGNIRAGGIADNFGGSILFSWNLGEIFKENPECYTGEIVSYGAKSVEYCHSIYGSNMVNPITFKGNLVGASIIEDTEIENTLNDDYEKYEKYFSDQILDSDKLVFLIANDKTVDFDREFIPNSVTHIKYCQRIPVYVLACIAAVIGIITILNLRKKWNYLNVIDKKIYNNINNSVPNSNKKSYIISIALVCAIFLVCFQTILNILKPNSEVGVTNLAYYGQNTNKNADILFLGSSAVFTNIEFSELWQQYGIASYCLGGATQDICDSYYRLIEADKKQHPNMVVVEVKYTVHDNEYNHDYAKVYNILGLNYSINKLNYVNAATTTNERLAFFLGFPVYHDRYHQVSKANYLPKTLWGNSYKGDYYQLQYTAGINSNSTLPDATDYVTYRALNEKKEYYLKAIIDYCKKQDIELLFISSLDRWRETDQPFYNTVQLIASEYSVPYLNLNLYDKETGFVVSDLLVNDAVHSSKKGARKCADFLGEYLVSHYDLADHRGDADYASWDRYAANRENLYLRAITEKDDYFAELVRDEKTVMAVPYRLPESKSEAYLSMQEHLQSARHFDWDKEDILYGEENAESFTFGDNTVVITKDYGNCRIDLNDGEDVINVTQPGMLLVVYDRINDEIVDMVLLERDSGYTLKHLYNP